MKKVLLLITALLTVNAFSQTVIFSEDFEDENVDGWQIGDLDGDGNNWEFLLSSDQAEAQGWGPNLTLMIGSFGYILTPGQEGPVDPDNIIITSAIDLPESSSLQLDFKVGTNIDYLNNHNFQVFIVEEFTEFDPSWTPFYEQNFVEISTAQDVSLDITEFAGRSVKIVFRHYNSYSQFVLLLDDIVITDYGTMAVQDVNQEVQFAVYPNPATDVVRVKTQEVIKSINVFNTQGKLVKTVASQNEVNVNDLPKGVYMIKVETANNSFTKKIIKK